MDAVEIILYVVIMIIWVIIQNSRKKKLKAQKEAQKNASEAQMEQYEEVLDEPKTNDRSLIDEIIRELKNEDELVEDRPEEQFGYNPEVKKDFSQKVNKTLSEYDKRLSEIQSKKKEKEIERFEHYKIEKRNEIEEEETENEYASLIFEDPDSPRKAIILSEILNRKHF
ncbi:hypothetical protein HZR84_03260 [Hyphobacterium sp. CCMP332]|nr:hypothetical protein HZR84_03260 [Hyphobacterium sp. CCMP332]